MNDDLTPDLEHASAQLDGNLGATERAPGEATPDVAALVQMLAGLRTELADVPAPPDARREQAIAAALAEFDLLAASPADSGLEHAAAASAGGATVLSFFRRKAPVLMGAAAAVVLAGVVGIAALGGRGSDDDSTASRVANEESADKEFNVASGDGGAGGAAPETMAAEGPASTITGINEPAVAAYVVNTPEELLGIAMLVVSDGVDLAPTATDGPTSGPTDASTVPPHDAGAYTWPGFGCPLSPSQVVLADIIWIDTPAYAVLDTSTGVVSAIDPACTVLVTAAP